MIEHSSRFICTSGGGDSYQKLGGGGGGGLQGRIYRALLRGGTLVEMTSQCTEHTWQNAKHDYLGGLGACPQGNF